MKKGVEGIEFKDNEDIFRVFEISVYDWVGENNVYMDKG